MDVTRPLLQQAPPNNCERVKGLAMPDYTSIAYPLTCRLFYARLLTSILTMVADGNTEGMGVTCAPP